MTRPLKSPPVISAFEATNGESHVLDSTSRRTDLLHAGALPDDPASHDLRGGEEEGVIADVFEDDSSPDERRFSRLRELCGRPAWTVEDAAWIICGFDREGYREGKYSHGESDGWTVLPGVKRERPEPEPEGMSDEELRQLRADRFRERCVTDEARHSRIGMTALRLAGLLNAASLSAHAPQLILEKAIENEMVPQWLDHARRDPELARILPATRVVAPGVSQWPLLQEQLPRDLEKHFKLARNEASGSLVCRSHMVALSFRAKHLNAPELVRALRSIPGLNLDERPSFNESTVRGWRNRYKTLEKVAEHILICRLLGLEHPAPPPGLPDLDVLLEEAEQALSVIR